jgi:hypothetical protein
MCTWAARGAADRGRGVVVDPASGLVRAGAGRPVGAGRRRSAHTAHGSANQGVRRQLAAVGGRVGGRVGARSAHGSAQVGGVGAGALVLGSSWAISMRLLGLVGGRRRTASTPKNKTYMKHQAYIRLDTHLRLEMVAEMRNGA